MSKISLLTASVLGVVGITASTMAFATNMESTYCKPGFYVGLQGGQSNTGYDANDLLKQAITDNHGYFNSYYYADPTFTHQNVDKIGMGGRLFAGYQFNPYFAMELGYTQFNKTEFSGVGSGEYLISHAPGVSNYTYTNNYSGDLTEHAVDLIAKGTLPLPYGFGAYLDAGMAYISSDRYINKYGPIVSYGDQTNQSNAQLSTIYTQSYQAVRPTYGAGLDYTIPTTPVDLQVFYQGISGSGAFSTTHLWGMGVGYKFA